MRRPSGYYCVTWATAVILAVLIGIASPARAETNPLPWTLLDPDARIPTLSAGHGAIVVLKLPDVTPATTSPGRDSTVSVFVDGTYQASLPLASWTYAEVCPGAHLLSAVRDKTILAVVQDQPKGQKYEFPAATVLYFQLLEDDQGTPRLQAVEAAAAQAAVEQLPRASHTLSRLQSKDCTPPAVLAPIGPLVAAAKPAPTVATNYTLRTSTFFDFDQSHVDPKRGHGHAELDDIIQKMRTSYLAVQRIELFGYADPTGSAPYNLALSRKRAQTVAAYLMQAGFTSSAITAKGMGATNLAVPDCATWLKTPQKIHACNEPNRRVELLVHGTPKN